MTTAEQEQRPDTAELDVTSEMSVRRAAAIRLGQLANYLSATARQLRDPNALVSVKQFGIAERGIQGIISSLTESDDLDAALATLDESAAGYAPERPRLDAQEYPDLPFYQGIISIDEIPPVEQPDQAAAVTLRILRNNHIEINGTVRELRGETLYMFNAFLAHRANPVGVRVILSHGFRESADPGVTRTRFHIALRSLRGILDEMTPDDFVSIQDIGLSTKLRERILNENFVIVDSRDDPDYHSLVVDAVPYADKRETAEAAEQEPQGYPLSWIARETGTHHSTLERRMTAADWEASYKGPGGVVLFPAELAKEIVGRFDEHTRPLEQLPDGWVRVSELIAKLPIDMMTSRALALLRKAGMEPRQVNLDRKYARRGGVWCVVREGALDALLDAPRRAPATQAARALAAPAPEDVPTMPVAPAPHVLQSVALPEQPPTPEPQSIEPVVEASLPTRETQHIALQLRNSAADIANHLANYPGLTESISARDIEYAAMTDTRVKPEFERDGSARYSYYAATRIITALLAARGLEYLPEE